MLIDMIVFFLSMLLYFYFNFPNLILATILILSIYRLSQTKKKYQKLFLLTMMIFIIASLLLKNYTLLMGTAMLIGFISLCLNLDYLAIMKHKPFLTRKKLKKFLFTTILILITLFHLLFAFIVFNPNILTSRAGLFFNEKYPPKTALKTRVEKINNHETHYYNLEYPSIFKNNTLDIYTCTNSKGTIFYIHGGGYVAGDKWNRREYLFRYVKDGYNVVNINYQLFPAAHYPDNLKQADDALYYIIKNASKYGIDSNKIILSGDSAGGQLAGQLALVLTNKVYSKQIGYNPKTQMTPKAFIGVSAWSDIQLGLRMNSPILEWFTDKVARSYFQVIDVKKSKKVAEASLVSNVNKNFPASFISDGNTGSFTTANLALVKRLKQLNVPVQGQFYDKKKVVLRHIFELNTQNNYAQEIYYKQLSFLDKIS